MGRIIRQVRQAGVYFVTTDTWQKWALFSRPNTAKIVVEQLLSCRDRGFYRLHAFVVMPDHLHVLLTPGETTTLEIAIQMIKGGSAHWIRQEQLLEFPVWHAGFHDRWIRDLREYEETKHYIQQNPVEARLAERAEGYEFSSAGSRFQLDPSAFDHLETGAKAPALASANVAAEAATHKSALTGSLTEEQRRHLYQLSWKTLPGLVGLACSDFRATQTDAPDQEGGVAVEFSSAGERDAFLAALEAHFAAQRFSNAAAAFEAVKTHILDQVAQRKG